MPVAFFDLDHTLLSGDSDQLWGDYLRARGVVDAEFQQRKDAFFAAYQHGELDIHAFHRFMLSTVKGRSWSSLQPQLQEFAHERIAPVIRAEGSARLHWHQQRGDRTVIITATNRVIATAAAFLFSGCDMIATEAQMHDETISGEISGTPSFREGKVTRAQVFCQLAAQALETSYFYSDSHNDLPLLRAVKYPHAVTPDSTLRRVAESQGWPILMWR